jgi:hypothetical protein
VNPALDQFKDVAEELRVEAVRQAELEGVKFAQLRGSIAA